MIVLLVAGLVLLGTTTWLVLQQATATDPALNHRLASAGLVLCLMIAIATLAGAVVIAL
ncbi:hypothetical protein [Actinoplanes sp. GCM10030250]|uniref:hypothetical protein n=1 Tax=Actinoplanes sp. GCM10030250 TaxID=3273376 RepID=UPI0036135DB5